MHFHLLFSIFVYLSCCYQYSIHAVSVGGNAGVTISRNIPKIFIALTRENNMNHKLNHILINKNKISLKTTCQIECIELSCIKCVNNEKNIQVLNDKLFNYEAMILTSPKVRMYITIWIYVYLDD